MRSMWYYHCTGSAKKSVNIFHSLYKESYRPQYCTGLEYVKKIMHLSVLLFDFYLLVFGSTEDFRSSMMWSISYKFGTAQGQIIGRLHEHCTELLGVFEIVVKRRSSVHPCRSLNIRVSGHYVCCCHAIVHLPVPEHPPGPLSPGSPTALGPLEHLLNQCCAPPSPFGLGVWSGMPGVPTNCLTSVQKRTHRCALYRTGSHPGRVAVGSPGSQISSPCTSTRDDQRVSSAPKLTYMDVGLEQVQPHCEASVNWYDTVSIIVFGLR